MHPSDLPENRRPHRRRYGDKEPTPAASPAEGRGRKRRASFDASPDLPPETGREPPQRRVRPRQQIARVTRTRNSDASSNRLIPQVEHWLEIELVDEDGRPVPNHPYTIYDRYGEAAVRGHLNPGGCAFIHPLVPGDHFVEFAGLDATEIDGELTQVSTQARCVAVSDTQRDWLEFEVIDEDEEPVVGVQYVIRTEDGQPVSEPLLTDRHGSGRMINLERGAYYLEFPALDATEIYRLDSPFEERE